MHHTIGFIQDLAVIMVIAGAVTILCHRFKQPVVLGYIIAGIIIGPHTPPFELINDETTISTLAELGVIFLLFSLGLEFSFKKLMRVGPTALVAAVSEIVLMLWLGYEIGCYFGWKAMDSLFLGAMLAISSTTIIIKALDELGLKKQRFAQVIFGILIVEDILAIAMIALLSSIASSGSVEPMEVAKTLGELMLFMTVSLVVGILLVPRLLDYVARFKSQEMLLITVLGLCFGFSLLVVKLGYSIVLGAFLIGAIMAESRQLHMIERLIEPMRDMFSAIFFVAIGLMFNPTVIVQYAWPITVITIAVILGKVLTCGLGTFVAGHDGRTSMRVGMGLAQIGEFSFIIAALGLSLKVTSDFLYPIAVAVSAITTLTTPYLIRSADPLAGRLAQIVPTPIANMFNLYSQWLQSLGGDEDTTAIWTLIKRIIIQIVINLALVAAIFIGVSYFAVYFEHQLVPWIGSVRLQNAVLWGGALTISMPFLVAVYRKLKSLSLLLVELGVKPSVTGRFTDSIRKIIAEVLPAVAMVGVFVLLAALSSGILPQADLLILVLLGAAILLGILWRWFVRIHARLQIALRETLNQEADDKH